MSVWRAVCTNIFYKKCWMQWRKLDLACSGTPPTSPPSSIVHPHAAAARLQCPIDDQAHTTSDHTYRLTMLQFYACHHSMLRLAQPVAAHRKIPAVECTPSAGRRRSGLSLSTVYGLWKLKCLSFAAIQLQCSSIKATAGQRLARIKDRKHC